MAIQPIPTSNRQLLLDLLYETIHFKLHPTIEYQITHAQSRNLSITLIAHLVFVCDKTIFMLPLVFVNYSYA